MGHGYISKTKGGAQVVSVCSAPEAELFESVGAQAAPLKSQADERSRRRKRR